LSSIVLSFEDMKHISMFEDLTAAHAVDCVIEEDRIIFVIKQGDMGLAIGKAGSGIKKANQAFGKSVEVVQASEDPDDFIRNCFGPGITVKSVQISEKNDVKSAVVDVEKKDLGLAIGKVGRTIKKVKLLASRHFGIDDVKLA